MAEMNVNEGKNAHNRRRQSTKVDLTAMVDLGFLLITFFMLATTMNKSHTMEINQPIEGKPKPYPESKTVTFMLASEKVYCYTATSDAQQVVIDSVGYGPDGIRKIIQQRQIQVEKEHGNKEELFVMIKPLPSSKYQNTVDLLDEMTINGVKRYAVLDPKDPVDILVATKTGNKLQ